MSGKSSQNNKIPEFSTKKAKNGSLAINRTQKRQQMTLNEMPEDILLHIIKYVDPYTITRILQTNKTLYASINSMLQSYIRRHPEVSSHIKSLMTGKSANMPHVSGAFRALHYNVSGDTIKRYYSSDDLILYEADVDDIIHNLTRHAKKAITELAKRNIPILNCIYGFAAGFYGNYFSAPEPHIYAGYNAFVFSRIIHVIKLQDDTVARNITMNITCKKYLYDIIMPCLYEGIFDKITNKDDYEYKIKILIAFASLLLLPHFYTRTTEPKSDATENDIENLRYKDIEQTCKQAVKFYMDSLINPQTMHLLELYVNLCKQFMFSYTNILRIKIFKFDITVMDKLRVLIDSRDNISQMLSHYAVDYVSINSSPERHARMGAYTPTLFAIFHERADLILNNETLTNAQIDSIQSMTRGIATKQEFITKINEIFP